MLQNGSKQVVQEILAPSIVRHMVSVDSGIRWTPSPAALRRIHRAHLRHRLQVPIHDNRLTRNTNVAAVLETETNSL